MERNFMPTSSRSDFYSCHVERSRDTLILSPLKSRDSSMGPVLSEVEGLGNDRSI
jgi:hypothetical protein